MSHLRDDVHITSGHISGHDGIYIPSPHESWSPNMSSSPSMSHHHPSSNPFYSPPMYLPSHHHPAQLHSGYLHPSQYVPEAYYYSPYSMAGGETIEGSVCDLDQKVTSLPSSVITPCTPSSSSSTSSSHVDPGTPITRHHHPICLPTSEMMSHARLAESSMKSSPESPHHHSMHEQQLPQTNIGINNLENRTPCPGITSSRPQAARSPFGWINTKKQASTGVLQGQTYPSSQPPAGNGLCRESLQSLFLSLMHDPHSDPHFERPKSKFFFNLVFDQRQAKPGLETNTVSCTLIIRGWSWRRSFASVPTLPFERRLNWPLN